MSSNADESCGYDSWEEDDSYDSWEDNPQKSFESSENEDQLEEFEKEEEEKIEEPFEAVYKFHVDNWKEKCKDQSIVCIPFFHEGIKFFVKINPKKESTDDVLSSFRTSIKVGTEEYDLPIYTKSEYLHFNLEFIFQDPIEKDIQKRKDSFFINIRNPNAEIDFIFSTDNSSPYSKMKRFEFELSIGIFAYVIGK